MKEKVINEIVQLLKAGQIVEIAGDFFRAVQVLNWEKSSCCDQCDLDSICRGDVFDVCLSMETLKSNHWILKLAHKRK